MALMSEISFNGRKLIVYNVHLESRGSDKLRIRQLSEILAEMGQYPAEMPVLIAGDFNFDVSRGPTVPLMAGMRIHNPFAARDGRQTVLKSRNGTPRAIDWMLTRGALAAYRPAIHNYTAASDHFPLLLELQLQ